MSRLITIDQINEYVKRQEYHLLYFVGREKFSNKKLIKMIKTLRLESKHIPCLKVDFQKFIDELPMKIKSKFHQNHVVLLGCDKILNFLKYPKWNNLEKMFKECISANKQSIEERKNIQGHAPDDRYDFFLEPFQILNPKTIKPQKADHDKNIIVEKKEKFQKVLQHPQNQQKSQISFTHEKEKIQQKRKIRNIDTASDSRANFPPKRRSPVNVPLELPVDAWQFKILRQKQLAKNLKLKEGVESKSKSSALLPNISNRSESVKEPSTINNLTINSQNSIMKTVSTNKESKKPISKFLKSY